MENYPRWDGRKKGHYEVWYITANSENEGFWIRYTLNSSLQGNDYSAVWIAIFDERNIEGFIKKYPLGEFKSRRDKFSILIGESGIEDGRAWGKIGDISWDIDFSPGGLFYHFPKWVYSLKIGDTQVLSPNINSKISGRILGNRIFARGCQTHLWGKKHAHFWVWGHASFEDGFFEGITVIIEKRGIKLPPITFFSISIDNKLFNFNSIGDILLNRSRFYIGEKGGEWYIRRKGFFLKAFAEKFILARYDDPDGDKAFCYNTEIGDAEIEFRGRKIKTKFHIEFGTREEKKVPAEEFKILS